MKSFDVIIAGGAMAGSTLALALNALSQRALSIAIIEPFQTNHHAHPGFDSRSIALAHGTVELLKSWGLWQSLCPFATPITQIHVSDRSHAGIVNFDSTHLGLDALGYVVELSKVGQQYAEKINACDNITYFCPLSVEHVERSPEHVSVTLSDQQRITGKLLVAADGALSTSSAQMGFVRQEHDFEQVALIANVVSAQQHRGRAFERFTASGPLALLPMSDDRLSLVWCLSAEQAEQMLYASDSEFLAQLQTMFGWRLGRFLQVGQRSTYPLILRYHSQTIAHRFVTIGNAAQTLHPIAGQGFNLGIRDIATLAQVLTEEDTQSMGEYRQLATFRQRREADRQATIQLTSTLVHLFSNDWLTLRVGRNLGLMAMENIPLLKAPLLNHTLG
ncbi:2-octaprenyl-6-methoxyphenyl hydroxylase [Vibrio sp. 11986-1-5]|uniref:2-octaprenyl-6-methoxyphenyl hydroxylase n=1 Tax=Vibrio sp. 11986-1-5 TaxID=2211215 RepID=UPI0015E85E89|nr:2-octaprenyl-6-methoxyphenyl hydroxylase [Vibrio sp. 11986-1-5]